VISEAGNYPSTPVRIDSGYKGPGRYYPPHALDPFAFQGVLNLDGKYHVRVTNGSLPEIRKRLVYHGLTAVVFQPPTPPQHAQCDTIPPVGVRTTTFCNFEPTGSICADWQTNTYSTPTHTFSNLWPSSPPFAELHSNVFPYLPNDSLNIPRTFSTSDSGSIFLAFHSNSDFVKYRMLLIRARDSAVIGVVDSVVFSRRSVVGGYQDTIIAPQLALDSFYIHYKIGPTVAPDSGVLAIELTHSVTLGPLSRSVIVTLSDSLLTTGSYKKAESQLRPAGLLRMTAHPNPFNPTTWLEVMGSPSLHTKLELMDILGRPIQTLYDSDMPESGSLHIVLNASQLASGVYFVRAISGNDLVTTRIELIK
jgi:hypothetical protein